MTEKILKSFRALDVKAPTDQPGVIECIASVTGNEDLGGDVIVPGAFKGYLASVESGGSHLPSLCWGHRADDLYHLTGKVLEMAEYLPGDSRLPTKLQQAGLGGLYVKGQYNLETQAGREAYAHVKAGDINEFSFMFQAPDREYDQKGRRLLKTINPIYEVSNVMVGMNPETALVSVKGRARVAEAKAIADEVTATPTDAPNGLKEAVDDAQEKAVEKVDCETCKGKGKIRAGKLDCPDCDGSGQVVPKAAPTEEAETKDMNGNLQVPVLEGEEAIHNGPLRVALDNIKELISQELAEDECEFGCILELALIAQRLIVWAQGEAQEDGGAYPAPLWFSAPPAETPEVETVEPTVTANVTALSNGLRLKTLAADLALKTR